MKRARAAVLGLLLIGVAAFEYAPASSAQVAWTTLLDGKNLDQWNTTGDANWSIVEGAAQADKGVGFLVSKASFTDFELRAEFWVDADANSGVFFRCTEPKDVTAVNAYEMNIRDNRPDQTYRTGAIVNHLKPVAVVNTVGRWNTVEITAKGPRITVVLNGVRTIDGENTEHTRGPIALQRSDGVVKFRKVEIR